MKNVYKEFDGLNWSYYFDGNCFRHGKREFRYACVATSNGRSFVVSLGNNKVSTRRSMANCYAHWVDSLEVFEIQFL